MTDLQEKIMVLKEREACARLAENYVKHRGVSDTIAKAVAQVIRNRQYTEEF